MAEAGFPASCPTCSSDMRRIFEVNTAIIMRPWGYSEKPNGDPKSAYWKTFDNPINKPQSWQQPAYARKNTDVLKEPDPEYVGAGEIIGY